MLIENPGKGFQMNIRKVSKKAQFILLVAYFLKRPMTIHFKKEIFKVILLCLFVFVHSTVPALADTGKDYKQKKNISLTALAIHQFNSNLDNGGDVSINRYFFQFDWNKRISNTVYTGISLHYNLHDYSFGESASLLELKTLEKVHSLGLGINLMYTIDEEWRLFVVPSLEFSGESGAQVNDSLIYGGIVATAYRVSPDLSIGAGVGIFSRLEEISVFPLIVIDWKITDKLRLSNPFRGGPSGPAGLELSYAINRSWEVGIGSAYRSFRFRLNDEEVASQGIFQERAIPVWGRLSWNSGARVKFDFNAGAFFAGKMKIEDQDGNELTEDNYNTAPFAAVTVSINF